MNECDRGMPGEGGLEEPQYRSGIEIALEDETEPADVIEELLAACQGQIAEAAGAWVIRAGPPGAAVFGFSDDDVIVTSPEELDPVPRARPGVQRRQRAATPSPRTAGQEKEAPLRINAGYLAEDGGRLRVAPLQLPDGALPRPGAAADGLGAEGRPPLPPPYRGAAARGAGARAARRGGMDQRTRTATRPSSSPSI